jgi:hypothetical protein
MMDIAAKRERFNRVREREDPTGILPWLDQQLDQDEKLGRAGVLFQRWFLWDAVRWGADLTFPCGLTDGLQIMAWQYRDRPGFKPEWTPRDELIN